VPQSTLTFSLAWKFNLSMQGLLGLPLAVGVAIAEALAVCDVSVRLKWPNDILKDGKKLGGVLIETATVRDKGQSQVVWAVIGVGLNMLLSDELYALLGEAATDAPSLMQKDRNQIMATLLNHLTHVLHQFEQEGFAAFVARWNALHAYADQAVVISNQGQNLHEGIAKGVDSIGRLMLESLVGSEIGPGTGTVSIMAGDVSLRLYQANKD
jgi:BirA family biotin operon repressor/biotin-[acetyl-CoA-carboxylase] ligase